MRKSLKLQVDDIFECGASEDGIPDDWLAELVAQNCIETAIEMIGVEARTPNEPLLTKGPTCVTVSLVEDANHQPSFASQRQPGQSHQRQAKSPSVAGSDQLKSTGLIMHNSGSHRSLAGAQQGSSKPSRKPGLPVVHLARVEPLDGLTQKRLQGVIELYGQRQHHSTKTRPSELQTPPVFDITSSLEGFRVTDGSDEYIRNTSTASSLPPLGMHDDVEAWRKRLVSHAMTFARWSDVPYRALPMIKLPPETVLRQPGSHSFDKNFGCRGGRKNPRRKPSADQVVT